MTSIRRAVALAAGAMALVAGVAAPAPALVLGAPIEEIVTRPAARRGPARGWTAGIVARARAPIGAPYAYGGMTPAGFDCSGFTRWVYESAGITLPHSSLAQYSLGGSDGFARIESMDALTPGDLVFHATSDPVGHAGIYVGGGRFVSATTSEGVQIRSLRDSYWGPLWVGGVRVASIPRPLVISSR